MVAIPDIAIRIIGATELPSKSVADDKTDKMYVPIPNIASVLLFIILFLFSLLNYFLSAVTSEENNIYSPL
jgi:hypothetical protein